MGNSMQRAEVLECERIVRDLETQIESFMAIEDGEEPLEVDDGVQSVLMGPLGGKTVKIGDPPAARIG